MNNPIGNWKSTAQTVRRDLADWASARLSGQRGVDGSAEAEHLRTLRRDGFVAVEGHWPRAEALRLRDDLLKYVAHGGNREFPEGAYLRSWDGRECDQGVRRIYHVERLIDRLSAFRHDPLTRRLAAAYYGFDVHSGVLVYQHNLASNYDTRYYHVDIFDKEFKAFLYLDDVDEQNGPFTYLRGSHRAHFTRLRRQIQHRAGMKSTSFAEADLGSLLQDEVKVCGPAGTLILADVRGLHRGAPQLSGARSVLVNYLYRHAGDVRIDA